MLKYGTDAYEFKYFQVTTAWIIVCIGVIATDPTLMWKQDSLSCGG